jgi:xylan 1,4-beta-xylosidase
VKRSHWRWLGLTVVLGAALCSRVSRLSAQLPRLIMNEVTADFAVGVDPPLLKSKYNLYDPDGITMQQFDKVIKYMGELNIDTYRIELAWGRRRSGFGTGFMITGTADDLKYDFTQLDHMVAELRNQNIQLLGSYNYNPTPLQDPSIQTNRDSMPPQDLEKWKQVIRTVVKHYKEIGIPFGINEVWNEPDGLKQFYSGTEEQYQKLFIATVEAIRSVDPDAVIGGPASAPELVWHRSFPEFAARNSLPLDFFTFHHYGSSELAQRDINKVVDSLNRFPHFNTTAMNLDEWHDADCCTWCHDDVRNRFEGAAQLLHDFKSLLERPELAQVSWAWWLDPQRGTTGCMGLITGDGRRKAVYNAWKIYATMPVDRKQVQVNGPLEAMASSDGHKAGVAVWNRDPYDRRFDLHLNNVPFAKGNIRIYRIDKEHASAVDGAEEALVPVPAETFMNVDTAKWTWIGMVPRNATMYFEAEDGSGSSDMTAVKVGKLIRIDRYYPERGKTKSYADFDRKTWIARLGMADSQRADQEIGALVEALPDTLDVAVEVDGKLRKQDANSLLAVRLDYRVNGKYIKSVLFHGPYGGVDLYDKKRTAVMPWGFKQQPDSAAAVADLSKFQIAVKKYAPADWAGTVHITFLMQNAGSGTRARIAVRPGT